MAKKPPPKVKDDQKIHIDVESWQWEASSPRITWKHWLAFVILLAVALLFVFGFLIIAAVVFLAAIIINIVLFLFRKLV